MTHCHYGTFVGVLSKREQELVLFLIADLAFCSIMSAT